MLVEEVHAVVLAGGSAPGLAAADGVVRALRERGVGFAVGPPGAEQRVPIVPGAILYDLGLGRPWSPGADAGERAVRAASGGRVAEGTVGAGTGATVAKLAGAEGRLKGGVGAASERLAATAVAEVSAATGGEEVVVGALVVVNALGAIVDPASGELVAGPRGPRRAFLDPIELLRAGGPARGTPPAPESTTLAVVATNAKLGKAQASVLAAAAHDGFARTIWPAHTRGDGDVAFGLATGAVELAPGRIVALEALAARAVERAVLRAVRLATGLAGVPAAHEWRARRPRGARADGSRR
jgi:L-aminopeptidase/D-esterase-like protein